MSGVTELPRGTVTFLFTDIEGSTRLLKQLRELYTEALAEHQRILRAVFEAHGGREIDTQGDSFFVAFPRAKNAVAGAISAQRDLAAHSWPEGADLRVRMGIHTGEPTVGEERYVGLGVHRAARICAAGHGGQVLVSQTTRELLRDDPLPDLTLRDLGTHQLKDLDEPERLYQLVAPGLPESFPPLKTAGTTAFAGREDELAEAAAEELAARRRRPSRRTVVAAALAAAAVGAAVAALVVFGGEPATVASVDANSVGVFDAGSAKLRKQIAVGASPGDVAASADAIWVANADDQTVSQIDPATNAVVQAIQVGAGPAGIAAGAGAAWVLNALDGTVARIDPKTRTVVWTVPVGNRPRAIAYGQDSLWVANAGDNTLAKVDPRTGNVIRTFGIEPGASGLAVGFGSLWVANAQTGGVARIHPGTGAVVGTIHVGNGPRALAVGADAVWVANTLDGTVSRIDPRENTVTAVLDTGPGPTGIAVGGRTVWVASEAGRLTRIDGAAKPPRVDKTISLGNPADGAALSRKSVFVAVRARSATHRGGTLRVDSGRRGLSTIDPSVMYETYSLAIPGLTNDGLVAFKHVGGSDGSTLVPDLATSLPQPTDKGKAYTFQLRPALRYSTGRPVHAEDFRRAIERVFRLHSLGRSSYDGIAGAERCEAAPKTCDLSHGIAVDNKARLVTFQLTEPDPDFLSKLAQPFAGAIPAGLPNHDVGTQPVPATGPYKIARYVPKRQLVFVRNPFFRPRPGRPDGYPDRIVWRLDVAAAPSTRAVEKGRADVAYDFVPTELLAEVKTEYASQLHVDPIPGTYFYYFDSRLRPFDDVRVRRALNYAVDRNAVIDSASRAEVAAPTCQVLPPNFPGYRPFCPYTAGGPSTRWVAPDLDRAKQLIAASGTKGERVTVWTDDKGEGAYVASVLRRLGYKTRLKTVVPLSKYVEAFLNPKNKIQIGALRWFPDYPAASGFINSVIFDCTRFCDRSIDRRIAKARAAQVTDPAAATALWADIDRRLTWQAPWLFLYNNRQADFVSERVGNFQYNLQYGILLDQMWVK